MEHINELSQILQGSLQLNKARLNCLSQIIAALFIVRTVNLAEIAQAFAGETKLASNYRRLQRFFRDICFKNEIIAKINALLFAPPEGGWYLSLDRTNWQFGAVDINILMLSLIWKGIAIPLMWIFLPKKGNSNTKERKDLLKRFIQLFGVTKIASLLMDREFIGDEWLCWLSSQGINFTVRIKHNIKIASQKEKMVPIRKLFGSLVPGYSRLLKGQRHLFKLSLWVGAIRLENKEWLIVVSNHDQDSLLERYALRWQIETLFLCLKSRGFRLEETHLKDPERLSTLLGILSIAFSWAHKVGEWQHEQKPIKIKNHGRKEKSFFRVGLDIIRSILIGIQSKISYF
jgi:hypothetical protein